MIADKLSRIAGIDSPFIEYDQIAEEQINELNYIRNNYILNSTNFHQGNLCGGIHPLRILDRSYQKTFDCLIQFMVWLTVGSEPLYRKWLKDLFGQK